MKKKGAIFFDRDGTLIRDKGYLSDPSGVEPFAGVGTALNLLRDNGLLLYLFTNQSGINRGWFDRDTVDRCNAEMVRKLGLSHGFDGECIAPETPDEEPVYRKPSPRFILETIHQNQLSPETCWMLGDRGSDWQAGIRAGINAAAIGHESTQIVHWQNRVYQIPHFASVATFVEWYLQQKEPKNVSDDDNPNRKK